MTHLTLKSAWKNKMELINIFDEKFLNEKDLALQPISFILELDENFNKENLKKKNLSNDNNLQVKNPKEEKEKSQKSQKSQKTKKTKNKDSQKRKSLKDSDLYSSNIVIIQSITDDGSNGSSYNKIEKEVEKLKRMMSRGRSKKNRNKSSKTKVLKTSGSAKY